MAFVHISIQNVIINQIFDRKNFFEEKVMLIYKMYSEIC